MARAHRFSWVLLVLLSSSCQGNRPLEEDPKDPEPRLRLSGKTIGHVIRMLGDPDEVAEGGSKNFLQF
jgi:hypothetical protein